MIENGPEKELKGLQGNLDEIQDQQQTLSVVTSPCLDWEERGHNLIHVGSELVWVKWVLHPRSDLNVQVLGYKWSLRRYHFAGLDPGSGPKVLDLELEYDLRAVIPVLDLG